MNETVQYSDDYDFFRKNQIAVSLSCGKQKAKFFSLIERRVFFNVTSTGIIDDIDVNYYIKMAYRHIMIEKKLYNHEKS